MRFFAFCLLSVFAAVFSEAQEQTDYAEVSSRGSIPEALLRPMRGEALFYPIDTVIGQLGQGSASGESYAVAGAIAADFLAGSATESGMEEYITVLEEIAPVSFRLGGGREEPDGAVSFLVRFIGREKNITGELFVRFVTTYQEAQETDEQEGASVDAAAAVSGSWTFDGLILEEAKTPEEEKREPGSRRYDFTPYERFF